MSCPCCHRTRPEYYWLALPDTHPVGPYCYWCLWDQVNRKIGGDQGLKFDCYIYSTRALRSRHETAKKILALAPTPKEPEGEAGREDVGLF